MMDCDLPPNWQIGCKKKDIIILPMENVLKKAFRNKLFN